MTVGIERIGLCCGSAFIDVAKLAEARGLNPARFANLLMRRKSLSFRFEDPVSFAVNAAKPVIDALSVAERIRQEAQHTRIQPGDVPVTLSGGLAILQPGEPLDQAIKRADQQLYAAKANGRNQIRSAAAEPG